ncbi:polyadenylate binding domain-containing protein [Actinokineospora pegani]|uniref:AsnC family protein n=1 Tax=Actinokineospora pegani TaxID=2654637 RepID=UPI0012EAC9F9|nr:AsnC family protein [Actinokineospora pegani]
MVAEMGRAAVHEVAARLGMDPREAASRLVALSGSGLPLLVGVECDQNGLRAALARQQNQQPGYGAPSQYQQPYPQQYQQPGHPGQHSGPYQVNPPSQPFQAPLGPPSQPFAAQPQHSGPVNVGLAQGVTQNFQQNPPSQPFPAAGEPMSTWGPPQVASWARGDQPPAPMGSVDRTQPTTRTTASRKGAVGDALETSGLEGERLSVRLVEVVDPADYLFTAAGYRLREGERSVVVHTELTNRGSIPFGTLPDLYLELVTPEGETVGKAPVSLSSRPPHRIGVAPGETAGGHTVYVVPEELAVTSVRWTPRPDEEDLALNWTVEN